jgi:hypothetical protein
MLAALRSPDGLPLGERLEVFAPDVLRAEALEDALVVTYLGPDRPSVLGTYGNLSPKTEHDAQRMVSKFFEDRRLDAVSAIIDAISSVLDDMTNVAAVYDAGMLAVKGMHRVCAPGEPLPSAQLRDVVESSIVSTIFSTIFSSQRAEDAYTWRVRGARRPAEHACTACAGALDSAAAPCACALPAATLLLPRR